MSRIEIVDHRPGWAGEFAAVAARLRPALGSAALRIDHIGSTAVPGLCAKDIIDVQVTVGDLADASVASGLASAGARSFDLCEDHLPPGAELDPGDLLKLLYVFEAPERRANVHVRVQGRFNQRYALLCRDYLRTHPATAAAYGEVKRRLAARFPDDPNAYYAIKDPAFDLFMWGAEEWAEWTGWQPGPSDG